jgi:rare lipoprotein A
MGTRLRVTWLDNGKSVEVRVNDRMSSQRRVVDLSRAAAKQLGILGRGIAKVKLEVLDEAGSEGKAAAEPEGQPTPAKGGNDDPPR